MSFVHLHTHNTHSLLDGYGTPENYVKRAKELGFTALALTNHGNIDGLLKFQKACKKEGIKPILGCEAYLTNNYEAKERANGHIVILVKNATGWATLLRLLTKANLDGFYYKPRIDFKWILSEDLSGLIFLTGCAHSFLTLPGGMEFLKDLKNKATVYLEVMPHNIQEQIEHNRKILEIGKELELSIVASNDSHYILQEQNVAQEVLLAIQSKAKWNDPNRWKFGVSGLHLRTQAEMAIAFNAQGVLTRKEAFEALNRTQEVADMCDFEIPKQNICLPVTRYEKDASAHEVLLRFCKEGKERLFGSKWNQKYEDRLNEEIEVLKNKGFERYFLIVKEILEFCDRENIMYGPGRGSVGASIAAYLIGITNVDPLKYDLLFWRFISPDRNDSPDIDLDFSDLHADKIRQHLEDEYGKNNIAGISTFMTMKGRGAVRDVARVFEIPNQDVDTFSKSIEDEKSEDGIIKEALVNTPEGREFYSKYPEVSDYAVTLEGTTRTAGQHPAAVIVSGEDLTTTNKCNLVRRKNNIVANWDMEDSEYNGLMKLDILKLKTLTVLAEAKRLIGGNIEYRDIPLDDPKVFENLSSGNLAGIFQLTGRSCESIIKEVGIDCFDDIPAINALARPGPLVSGLTAEWIKRKKGGEWEKKHPIYEEITKDTLGITCFQENICLIFTQIAGLSPSTADKIRKVIGKKRDPKEFEPFKEEFAAGCKKMGTFSEDEVEEFWAQLLEFASYAFPKAHAVEYGMVGVWTAWIKTYYPTEFFAANLSYGAESSIPALIREIGNTGLRVVTPKAGISDPIRWIAKDGYLYMPFIQIRGIGENKAEKCSKMKKRVIPEGLGFFDDVGGKKSELDTLMEEIKAYDLSPEARPDHPEKYFDFEIEKAEFKKGLIKKARYRNPEASDCIECDLRKQASQVVLPSVGQCNVMILGEAPGSRENEKNQGFIGDSGDLVWGEIAKYGYTRRLFHVSNCVKCYPRYTKTPTKDQVKVCFRWLEDEIQNLQCKLILAMGNTPLLALTGKEGGIVKLNGQTEWLPKLQTWVCWCVHPAMVLRDRNNMEYFREGVKNFIETFEKLKGK